MCFSQFAPSTAATACSFSNINNSSRVNFSWVKTSSLPVPACWCAHGKYAQKLLKDLFTNYTSALRPVEDTNKILNVTLQVTLSQIIDMVQQHSDCMSERDLRRHPRSNMTSSAVLFATSPLLLSWLFSVVDIFQDERNQILTAYLWIRRVWVDAHLKWKKDDYDGLDTIRIPSSYVWRPDIVLYNK